MTKQLGRAYLIKIKTAVDTFTPFLGLTAKTLKIGTERIDATTPDATAPEGAIWRETLAGVKSLEISGDYTLVGDGAEAKLAEIAMSDNAVEEFQAVVPGVGTYEGSFSVDVEFGDDGKVTGSMSLASTGKPTFTAAS